MRKHLNLATMKPLLVIVLIGFIIRLIFLLDYLSSPDWPQLLADSLFHDRWAMSIASGDVIGQEAYFRAPFYIYLLGLIYAIFGHSLLAARIFGHLIGLVAVATTYLLANRLFSKRASFIAGLIHALYPVAIYFESELLVDNLFMMLIELSVLLILIACERQSIKWFIWVGIVIGLAAVTRPIILALLPLYGIWLLIYDRPLKKSLIHYLIVGLFTLVIIVPVTLRNFIVADDFIPIASSGGINFYIGNNNDADGLTATLPPPLKNNWGISDITFAAEKETGRKMKASEISDFWYKKGQAWIKNNPGEYLKLYFKKLYYMFNNSEISNNRSLPLFFIHIMTLKFNVLSFGLIFPLAVMAVISLIIHRGFGPQIILVCLILIGYTLVISLFFINARFRLPIVPFIILFAAGGIDRIAEIVNNKQYRKVYLFSVAGGVAACFLTFSGLYNIQTKSVAAGYFNKGNYYLSIGDYKEGVDYFNKTLEINPNYPDANLNLGAVYLKIGQADSAEAYFRRELNNYPTSAETYSNLASLYNLQGEYTISQIYADSAIELKPYAIDPYLISLRNYNQLGDSTPFESNLHRAENSLSNINRVYLDAGIIYTQWDRYNRALEYLQKVLDSPDRSMETNDEAFGYSFSGLSSENAVKARAAYQMGYIYGLTGELDKSVAKSEMAIMLDSNLTDAYVNLINGYMLIGRQDEAMNILTTARQKFPGNEILNMMFQRLQ